MNTTYNKVADIVEYLDALNKYGSQTVKEFVANVTRAKLEEEYTELLNLAVRVTQTTEFLAYYHGLK
jgi:hypothetical protein